MAQIKIVPENTPNSDGEWIDIAIDLPHNVKWLEMERLIAPFIPDGYTLVAAERGPREKLNSVTKLKP